MANIKKETLEQLKNEGFIYHFYNDLEDYKPTTEHCNAIEIVLSNFNENIIAKCIKLPKKMEVTFDWLMSKINQDSEFISLAKECANLVNSKSGVNIYPASYGVGFCNIFGKDEKTAQELDQILKNKGVAFRNEFSEAGWVYRFVISKSKENINKISST